MGITGTEFNFTDVLIISLILISIIAGIRQGLVSGLLDLLSIVVGIYVAFKGYPTVSRSLDELLSLSHGIANLAAFFGLFVVVQILFSIVFGWLLRGFRRLLRLFPALEFADAIGGSLPGLVKGLVAVIILLLPFGLYPIVPGIQTQIESSFLGSRLISLTTQVSPRLESYLGQTAEDTLTFLAPPESGKPLKLNLPSLSKLKIDASSEQTMLELINQERAKAGLRPLVIDNNLQEAARNHSTEMFNLSYFAHESPVAGTPFDRMRAEGVTFTMAAENIAYAPNVEIAHNGLMNSPGHRKNILTPGFKRIGIGVIDGGLKGKMFTQDFTD